MVDKDGYVLIHQPGHPYADRHGYVREHRLVMEQELGRHLSPDEVVHHKNKNKQDNRPENLGLYATNALHLADELKGKVPNWTPEGFARIKGRPRKSSPAETECDGPLSQES